MEIDKEPKLPDVIKLAKESEYKEDGRDEVLGDIRRLAEPKTCLIFVGHAKRLEVGVGDVVTVTVPTGSGRTNTLDATVVAVAQDLGFMTGWAMFLNNQDVLDLYDISEDTTSAVMLYLDDPDRAEEVMGHLREVYEKEGYVLMDHDPQPFFMKFDTVMGEDWTGQKLDLTIWRDEVSFLTWVVTALDGISLFLVGILMVIIMVGIMNTMWISVQERTQEVGTIRAIGMTRTRVLLLFLTEALLLGLIATTLGALIGAGIAAGLDAAAIRLPFDAVKAIMMGDTLHLSVGLGQLVKAVVSFTLVTGLSALWPAFRASRMEPVTAMHHVG